MRSPPLEVLRCLPCVTQPFIRLKIGRLGTDMSHPAFHTRWAQRQGTSAACLASGARRRGGRSVGCGIHAAAAPSCSPSHRHHKYHDLGKDIARQRGLGPRVESCARLSAERGLHHSMAPASRQAVRWGLPYARRQRYFKERRRKKRKVFQSLIPALTMDACASSPASAMSCSHVRCSWQRGSGSLASR